MRGAHSKASADVLASQDFEYFSKRGRQAVERGLPLNRTCNGRLTYYALRRILSYSGDQEMWALRSVVVAAQVRRGNGVGVCLWEYRWFPLAAMHGLAG